MYPLFRFTEEGIKALLGSDGGPKGNISGGDSLGDRHDVGDDIPVLAAEGKSGTTKAGNHLIQDQQNAPSVADLPESLQIAVRRHEYPSATDHRFGDDGGNSLRSFVPDSGFDLVGAGQSAGRGRLAMCASVAVWWINVEESWNQGLERPPSADLTGRGEGAEGKAVGATVAGDHLVTVLASVNLPPVLPRQLQGGLDCLGAAVAEIDSLQSWRCDRRQCLGQPDRGSVRLAEGGGREAPHLLGRRL